MVDGEDGQAALEPGIEPMEFDDDERLLERNEEQHPLAMAFKLVLMLFLCGHRASPSKFAWMCVIAVFIFAYVSYPKGACVSAKRVWFTFHTCCRSFAAFIITIVPSMEQIQSHCICCRSAARPSVRPSVTCECFPIPATATRWDGSIAFGLEVLPTRSISNKTIQRSHRTTLQAFKRNKIQAQIQS